MGVVFNASGQLQNALQNCNPYMNDQINALLNVKPGGIIPCDKYMNVAYAMPEQPHRPWVQSDQGILGLFDQWFGEFQRAVARFDKGQMSDGECDKWVAEWNDWQKRIATETQTNAPPTP